MECLLPYFRMVIVLHMMVRLERILDYRGVGLARFHSSWFSSSSFLLNVILSNNYHSCPNQCLNNGIFSKSLAN